MKKITIKIEDAVYEQLQAEVKPIHIFPTLANKFLHLLIHHIENNDTSIIFATNTTKNIGGKK